MNNYFNQVLHAFSTMDIEQLEDLLDPDITYSDVTKALFLERLGESFKIFRKEGESFLTAQPGTCFNFNCNPDSICTAYRFVGSKTRLYLDLRFITEMTEDFKDHYIRDIYGCSCLSCFQAWDWYGGDVSLIFYFDEDAHFVKTPELILHIEKQKEAMSELKSISGQITEAEIRSWLLRYHSSYDYLESYSDSWYYSWISFILGYRTIMKQLKTVELITQSRALQDVLDGSHSS